MLYNVTSEFIKVAETTGTIQNTSQCYPVEISDTAEENSGFWLFPLNRVSFSGEVYLRCTEGGGRAQINVVSFITDSGGGGSGGGSYVDDSQVAPDSDIDDLLNDIFGDDSQPSIDEPSVADDADIDSLLEDIFTNGAVYNDDPSPSTDGVLVDDSRVASDEDIDSLINDIFG